jgi:hypothetical protein
MAKLATLHYNTNFFILAYKIGTQIGQIQRVYTDSFFCPIFQKKSMKTRCIRIVCVPTLQRDCNKLMKCGTNF